ncbi:craniofacial development protein 2-like [Capsicum annuum]|uniref:craniofacial development protein 2-like n=1 Tax=Capsicum annuum TaxID=4072 RepID=UPI001FB19987|nr:craniofacial development protein 2-like [Capsicum annuum]
MYTACASTDSMYCKFRSGITSQASATRFRRLISAANCRNQATQQSLDDEEKKRFWEDLDEMVRGVPSNEKLFIRGDFNGHIGSSSRGYDDVHGGYRFGVRNVEGVTLLDFARAFRLVVGNFNFPKKEVHLTTFYSSMSKTQIVFLFLKKGDRGICKDCNVLPSESISTQHRILVMDLEIRKE